MRAIEIEKRGIGINFEDNNRADIVVWAPNAIDSVCIDTSKGEKITLAKGQYGYWATSTEKMQPGDLYKVKVDDEYFPDPASLCQPDGVDDYSQAVQGSSYRWTDNKWKNVPLKEFIIYELHIGTFSKRGDFSGAEEKLPYLKELGITAIEIMPVAQFPGERNWGYDGVFPFAVQNSYGGVQGLKKFVNACHNKGIAVILDVVYNHLGPEGNVFDKYGPYYTDMYKTPWGNAINFDDAGSDEVRRFFLENILMWFRDFHIDALRLDAVHAIKDFSANHFLKEAREYTDRLKAHLNREFYLIIECDLNDVRYLDETEKGGYNADAQWVDEFHHALRVAAGQETQGYYSDFDGIGHLANAYTNAYVYNGIYSEHRLRTFGSKANAHSGDKFVVFSQNHDQVGNRMLGERTSQLVSFEMLKLLAGAIFISPYIPLLFMGEEWAAPNPFLYFADHAGEELKQAVREGRKKEFASFFNDSVSLPDPFSMETFHKSTLSWELLTGDRHRVLFNYYKALIALRKAHEILKITDRKNITAKADIEKNVLVVERWNATIKIIALLNFSDTEYSYENSVAAAEKVWDSGNKEWDSGNKEWGGNSTCPNKIDSSQLIKIQPHSIVIYQHHV